MISAVLGKRLDENLFEQLSKLMTELPPSFAALAPWHIDDARSTLLQKKELV